MHNILGIVTSLMELWSCSPNIVAHDDVNKWKYIMKTHVRGFFDTDLHEVSWHFATHEAVRPSGF